MPRPRGRHPCSAWPPTTSSACAPTIPARSSRPVARFVGAATPALHADRNLGLGRGAANRAVACV
eukprot:9258811-Pyramimonas_sp.AAC.1